MKYLAALLLWSAAVSHSQLATELSYSQRWAPDEYAEQAARLVRTLTIPEERLRAIPYVLNHLELVLSTRWPGSRVIVYGSIAHGLATAFSDVDCTIILPHSEDPQTLIEEAATTLQQYPHLFSNLHPLPWVRIPVVTFKHLPTQFDVDLVINNYSAIQDNNLWNHLIKSHWDKRIYYLTFIVKYWGKVHDITDSRTLPSHGLVTMVIFYLQQINMLPPIASLQLNANPFYVDDWNIGFCQKTYETQHGVVMKDLLGGFFEYYADFDYDRYIVSPYAGYPIEKTLFSDVTKVPSMFGLYVHNVKANVSKPLSLERVFVLQDVFRHNDNVAELLNDNSTFITHFRYAAMKFREKNSNFLEDILRTNKETRNSNLI